MSGGTGIEPAHGAARRLRQAGRLAISFETIGLLLPLVDAAIILAASVLGAVAYNELADPGYASVTSFYGLGMVAAGLYVFRMRDIGHYDVRVLRRGRPEFAQIAQTWAISTVVLLSLLFLFKLSAGFSRAAFLAFLGFGFLGLTGWRGVAKYGVRRGIEQGWIGKRNVLLIGEPDEIRAVNSDQLSGFFGVADVTTFALADGGDAPLCEAERATLDAALAFAKDIEATEIMLAVGWGHAQRLEGVRESLRVLPVPVRLLPDRQIRSLTQFPSLPVDPTLVVEMQRPPLSQVDRALKRCMDIVVGSAALLVFAPVVLMAMVAIKLESSGPVLFRQRRYGFNKRAFAIYKLRTMSVQEDGPVIRQATVQDPRVTRVGRFLRGLSIDEMPQLLNVLKGEMSLVGPRPHALTHDDEFEQKLADYAFRRHVKPGITGWAQCRGNRGPTPGIDSVRARVSLDLWYINNWSIWLDLKILARTAVVIWTQKNAV